MFTRAAVGFAALIFSSTALAVPFDPVVVDDSISGDCKAVADMDGDGFADLIVGGMPNEGLNWYRYPNWSKTHIATPSNEFTTDCGTGDVDGDGDVDIVAPDGNSGNNIQWFENPTVGGGNPQDGAQWIRHAIGGVSNWAKDIDVVDFDGNGRLDIATRTDTRATIFFNAGSNTWSRTDLSVSSLGVEGMTSGDVDGDGDVDLVFQGAWLDNPGGSTARSAAGWEEYPIGSADPEFKALVADVDGDGQADVLFSSSENTANVQWWRATTGNPRGSWTATTIVANWNRAHTLQAGDMDGDGDTDVVVGQMHTASNPEISIYLNANGSGGQWTKDLVNVGWGLHNGVVADIGNDGDLDIFGANWTGNPPVRLWVNKTDPLTAVSQWTYIRVSSSHAQTFGLACGDVDADGRTDIVSGLRWYKNPGSDLTSAWSAANFPSGKHAILVTDVDGDSNADVIAQQTEGSQLAFYWLEAPSWSALPIGTVPAASHALGTQGFKVGQVRAGARPEVVVSSGDGIYYFEIPASPGTAPWTRVHVDSGPSDEGFGLGDIDRDGDIDIAATTGDAKGVEWYENPGDGSADWAAHALGSFPEALYPDRTEVADLNGDGRLDAIVSEENGADTGAETYWWAAPTNPSTGSWTRHLLGTQATTNSMHIADMDRDGDVDVVTGEHRGSERVSVWVNSGAGTFTPHIVDTGKESHLGVLPCDLDADGDLDLVSIAYDDFQLVHLWRNDGGTPPVLASVPRPPTNVTVE